MKKIFNNRKSWLLIMVSIILLVLFLWTLADKKRLEEDNYESQIYLMVMYDLDQKRYLYDTLNDLLKQAAQSPKDAEVRAQINGILRGISISHQTAWPLLYKSFTDIYGDADQELSDDILQHMNMVRNSLCLTDEEIAALSTMSSEHLNRVAKIYMNLSDCFFRSDNSFGDLLINYKFEDSNFAASLQEIESLLLELDTYLPVN